MEITKASKIGKIFKQKLVMQYSPVGFYFADKKPEDAIGFKKPLGVLT